MGTQALGEDTLHIERESKSGAYTSVTQFNTFTTVVNFNNLSLEEVNEIIKAATELRENMESEIKEGVKIGG